MQPDPPVPYATGLHRCASCLTTHRLDVLPVKGGFVAGVRCKCREPNGTPRRYSTESRVFPTYERADTARRALLRMAVAA